MKKNKVQKIEYERESYRVRFNLLMPSGFWKTNIEETVILDSPLKRWKNNHDAAAMIIKKKYPKCVIKTVIYE